MTISISLTELGDASLINRAPLGLHILRKLGLAALPIALLSLTTVVDPAEAQLSGDYQTPQERDLYNTVPGNNDKGTILDATNPMDLMNRLQRSTAMDDATAPSDAIDAALKALELESSEASANQP
ncbi:hypothetical protein PMIT1313_00985 [Prochlorococcus marinus str. MIT 1313]|uniref:hypothetical protein n=1 Tax=Prochlorococcus TaxID=1218 RepID=UPI0007BB8353|nr:hypothetical protein [Prochlorococcus marinus]KZR69875.1 hypothetical protein PMIT1313_00985 [Prochlorococcus marinus str. MIT 1313]KZR72222.1 hypothetical protein PMIT1318_01282 [Prochlorococcus marinus str. MIT 1318]